MDLHLTLEGDRDLSKQLYRQLRAAIADGRLRRGDRLPPSRELAKRLELARNTVGLAYEWLTVEGLLAGRAGAGTFVAAELPVRARPPKSSREPVQLRAVWHALAASASVRREDPAPPFDFDAGTPDARLFPYDDWRRLMARALRAAAFPAGYGDPAGHPRLRAAIARHVGASRGVSAGPEDVLVTHGAQQALDLLGRVLIEPGSRVAVEEPGYPPARRLFESLGARVEAVRVDSEGLDVAALPEDARLVYVTPSHQFPLGMPLSLARRRALLAWAERRNAVVIEDDYDSEFRFGGRPLDTLQSMDRGGRVVYVGSFSKVMLPALRLGFLVAPPSLYPVLTAALQVSGWHAHWPAQAALARFIEDGLLARHLRKMRREYALRHDRLATSLTRDFSAWLEPIPSEAGLHLTATLKSRGLTFERDLVRRALGRGVRVGRLSGHYAGEPARAGLVFGYGAIPAAHIDEGLKRLRACFTG